MPARRRGLLEMGDGTFIPEEQFLAKDDQVPASKRRGLDIIEASTSSKPHMLGWIANCLDNRKDDVDHTRP